MMLVFIYIDDLRLNTALPHWHRTTLIKFYGTWERREFGDHPPSLGTDVVTEGQRSKPTCPEPHSGFDQETLALSVLAFLFHTAGPSMTGQSFKAKKIGVRATTGKVTNVLLGHPSITSASLLSRLCCRGWSWT